MISAETLYLLQQKNQFCYRDLTDWQLKLLGEKCSLDRKVPSKTHANIRKTIHGFLSSQNREESILLQGPHWLAAEIAWRKMLTRP